jgi:hypothetical protein
VLPDRDGRAQAVRQCAEVAALRRGEGEHRRKCNLGPWQVP